MIRLFFEVFRVKILYAAAKQPPRNFCIPHTLNSKIVKQALGVPASTKNRVAENLAMRLQLKLRCGRLATRFLRKLLESNEN